MAALRTFAATGSVGNGGSATTAAACLSPPPLFLFLGSRRFRTGRCGGNSLLCAGLGGRGAGNGGGGGFGSEMAARMAAVGDIVSRLDLGGGCEMGATASFWAGRLWLDGSRFLRRGSRLLRFLRSGFLRGSFLK